jgi:YidC/Oxa1 family membrane protein insertase
MMFMPIIFVVFCYNFAAALALYYTTQNLLTILQLYQNRRQPIPILEKVAKRKK